LKPQLLTVLTLILVASFAVSGRAAQDEIIPKIVLTVKVTPKAQDKLTQEKRTIEAAILYDATTSDGGNPQTTIYTATLEFSANGGTATVPEVNFTSLLNQKGKTGKFTALEFLNIYTPHGDDQTNLIDCGVKPGGVYVEEMKSFKEKIEVFATCKLIDEK
jgi:hypothetical protein